MNLKDTLIEDFENIERTTKKLEEYDEVWFIGDLSQSFAGRAAVAAVKLPNFSGVVVSNITPSKRLRISGQIGGTGYWQFIEFEGIIERASKNKVLLVDFNDTLAGCMFRNHFISNGLDVCDYIRLYNDLKICHTYLSVDEERNYFFKHLDEYIELINSLQDDLSKQTVIARIKSYISLDRRWLMRVAQGHHQFTSERFSTRSLVLSNEEIYIDVGAAHGDTVAAFFNFSRGQYDSIHAFEPDPVNFGGLKRLCDVIPRSYCYNKGLSDDEGNLSFKEDPGNRFGSRFEVTENNTGIHVQTVRLDDVLEKATLVKIDVEGFENKAINGASRIIMECAPSMHIAGYHYPKDLLSIIDTVNNIHKYKNIAIRHCDGSLYDTNILFSDHQPFS